ncbi:hypothetical protein BV372_30780 [Nostoc sp. T09]|nr:hypothetical protein BV372_30780 [Nostoc sp. T09]
MTIVAQFLCFVTWLLDGYKGNRLILSIMITVIYSDKFLLHYTGENHPERPERLLAIVAV